MRIQPRILLTVLAVFAAEKALAQSADDQALIDNAVSAAPEAVGNNAAVMKFGEGGELVSLREGTNGFTCFADDPATPVDDPACWDANGLLWLQALIAHEEPPEGKVGISYMLKGGTGASNLDPYMTEPPAGQTWMNDPPHMMVVNSDALNALYPTGEHPDASQPYVMYPDTPYAHIMIPVE
jgi:hypothetical protein